MTPNLTRSDDDVVDWDEDEFYKEAYESHHNEPNRCTKCYLREFFTIGFVASLDETSAVLREPSQGIHNGI